MAEGSVAERLVLEGGQVVVDALVGELPTAQARAEDARPVASSATAGTSEVSPCST